MAMWIPGFVGDHHPQHAVAAGRALVDALAVPGPDGVGFPAGVGVHTGVAWVGVVGEEPSVDFSVIGDAPNTVARLGSSAGAGELLLSDAVVSAAGVDTAGMDHRTLDLRGKSQPFGVWVQRAA
jgi:adenylate cyclase